MNIERFNTIAAAIGFQQIEDEEGVYKREGLPVEQFIALIEQLKQRGFDLAEIELSFTGADSDDVICFTHDPDDDTAFMELLSAEELTES
jgi:hypothetical protein